MARNEFGVARRLALPFHSSLLHHVGLLSGSVLSDQELELSFYHFAVATTRRGVTFGPISYEKALDLELSGEEVHYAASSLLVIFKKSCCELHCRKVSIQFPLHKSFWTTGRAEAAGSVQDAHHRDAPPERYARALVIFFFFFFFFFFFVTLEPSVEVYRSPLASNTSPARNRFTILRSSCS